MTDVKELDRALAAYNAVWDAAPEIDAKTVDQVRRDAMTAALEALSRDRAGEQKVVAVKPLEWNEYAREGAIEEWDAEAGSFGAFYNFQLEHDGYRLCFDFAPIGTFDTTAEAKAAAQADFEKRIMSSLASAPPRASDAADTVAPATLARDVAIEWLTSLSRKNLATMEAARMRLSQVGTSHYELDAAIDETATALRASSEKEPKP